MTLVEIIERLAREDRCLVLPTGFSNPHSYRGHYDRIAFEPASDVAVGTCIDVARDSVGRTFIGWKGGEYEMIGDTRCYFANEGDCGEEIGAMLLEALIALAKERAR